LQTTRHADNWRVEAAGQAWRPLGELLLQKGLVTRDELEAALSEQETSGRLLGAILVDRGYVSGPALAVALAEQYGVELKRERAFGTGLWAEIDRRHRARRGANGDAENVVKLEPGKPTLEAVPDPDPQLDQLEAENRRLLDEIERLKDEFTKLRLIESPQPAASHVLFVPTSKGYLLLERLGPPPEPGEEVEVSDEGDRFLVTKVGRAPFPGERRPCAYLLAQVRRA
jgi:hypothetical protein